MTVASLQILCQALFEYFSGVKASTHEGGTAISPFYR